MNDLLLVILLFLLSALFSGSEVSIFSLKDNFIAKLERSKGYLHKTLLDLLDNKSSCLIVILVGNLTVNIFLSSKVSQVAMQQFGEKGLAYAVFIVTVLLILFSEIAPKTIALKNAKSFAMASAPLLYLIKHTVYPVIRFLDRSSEALISGVLGKEEDESHLSADELSTMVSLGAQQGVFHGWEKKLIEQIFEFQEVYALERMVPRPDIIAVEASESRETILEKVLDTSHSKIPVYEGDLDYITAYFQVKDLMLFPEKSVSEMMKPVYLIPERKPIGELLKEMQTRNIKMAVLLDEYGNTQGIITLEDVLEAIFGEWRDPETSSPQPIRQSAIGTYLVQADTSLREINAFFDEELIDEEEFEGSTTIAAFVMGELNRLPHVGDFVEVPGLRIRVCRVDRRRLLEVELIMKKTSEEIS